MNINLQNGAQAISTRDTEIEMGFCGMPEVPERQLDRIVSELHEQLIRNLEKKWVNGTELRYYYFRSGKYAGGEEQVSVVEKAFDIWREVGIGISFTEVDSLSEAELRIGFRRGDGSWSYLGRDIISIPGQKERTMNFGWDLTKYSGGLDTAIHEIGHTLGFPHEHQNPFSGIVWDEQAVLETFRQSQGWNDSKIHHNILRKLHSTEVEGGQWDPNSIMHYPFGPGLILQPEKHRNGIRPTGGLSQEDERRARQFYPSLDPAGFPSLIALKSQALNLMPGEQSNLNVIPRETREYTFSTFGDTDVVMVLFEKRQDGLHYINGNDSSGTDQDASLRVRLNKGTEYVLRIRMYLNYGVSDSAVMMW